MTPESEPAQHGSWSPARVGTAIRAVRRQRGLSVTQLAHQSGLSQSFLSQVEAGNSDISVGRLIRLAQALQVTPTDLLESPAAAPGHLVRAQDRVDLPTPTAGLRMSLLSPSLDHARTYAFGELEPGAVAEPAFRLQASESFVFMLAGAVSVDFANGESVTLRKGDALSYLSESFERMTNVDAGSSSFVWVQSALPPAVAETK